MTALNITILRITKSVCFHNINKISRKISSVEVTSVTAFRGALEQKEVNKFLEQQTIKKVSLLACD
jgi:hypothetical protein